MRVICGGSRLWDRQDVVDGALDIIAKAAVAAGDRELVIVHGACFPAPNADGSLPLRSADWLAELWARRWNRFDLRVRPERWPAEWSRYGRRAGPRRNGQMVEAGADLVLAFHRDLSSGTADLIERAEKAEITTRVIDYDDIAAEVSS
jgi:hypothetical protein